MERTPMERTPMERTPMERTERSPTEPKEMERTEPKPMEPEGIASRAQAAPVPAGYRLEHWEDRRDPKSKASRWASVNQRST